MYVDILEREVVWGLLLYNRACRESKAEPGSVREGQREARLGQRLRTGVPFFD